MQWLCVHICKYIVGGSEQRKYLKTNVFVYDYLDILLYCLDTYFDYIYNTKVDIDGVKVGATLVGVDDEDEFYLFRFFLLKVLRLYLRQKNVSKFVPTIPINYHRALCPFF